MKKLVQALALCGLASISVSALAADSPHSVTGNLSFVTDYQYRGISQTDEDPAIQGGFDYAHSNGFYAGIWGSNVEWNTANMEIDVYAGYSGKINDDLSYNVGLLQYYYPDYDDAGTLEMYGGVTYKYFGLKASYSLTDYFDVNDSEGTVYWDASFNYPLPADMSLGLHYGYTSGEGAQDDYADWKLGISKTIGGFSVGLAYTDTDIDGCAACDERFILSVGKTF